jgi:hypothetical protein
LQTPELTIARKLNPNAAPKKAPIPICKSVNATADRIGANIDKIIVKISATTKQMTATVIIMFDSSVSGRSRL